MTLDWNVIFVFFYFTLAEYAEGADSTTDESDAAAGATMGERNIQKIHFQPSISRRNANRYALQFHRETVKELKAMKEAARLPIEFILRSDLEVGSDYFDGYDFPIRPKWSFEMTKEQLDRNENRYFTVSEQLLLCKSIDDDTTVESDILNLFTIRRNM